MVPLVSGFWSFKMDKDVDWQAAMWADIPSKNGGQCAQGALSQAPTSGNALARAWHKGKYDAATNYYMEANTRYPGVQGQYH